MPMNLKRSFYKSFAVAACFAGTIALCARNCKPVMDADFCTVPGQIISLSGHRIGIGKQGKYAADKNAVRLNGTRDAYVLTHGTVLQADGKTFSGLFRLAYDEPGMFENEQPEIRTVGFGSFELIIGKGGLPTMRLFAKSGDLLGPDVVLQGKTPLQPGKFYDFAFRYSTVEQLAEFYIDGVLQDSLRGFLPELNIVYLDAGRKFLGRIARIRLYDGFLTVPEMNPVKLTETEINTYRGKLREIIARNANPFLTTTAQSMLELLPRLETYGCTEAERELLFDRLESLDRVSDQLRFGVHSWIVSAFDLPVSALDDFDPDRPMAKGKRPLDKPLRLVMAQNLRDHVPFLIYPYAKIGKFELKATDLVSKDGKQKIPSDAVRISVLQHGFYNPADADRLGHIRRFAPLSSSVLIPLRFTTDPDAVRVDIARRYNETAILYPDGEKAYLREGTMELPRRFFQSAPATLKEVEFDAPFRPQVFLAEVTANNAPAGLYNGTIELLADGQPAGEIPIAVRVLPFRTGEPMRTLEFRPGPILTLPDKGTSAYLAYLVEHGSADAKNWLSGIRKEQEADEYLRLKAIEWILKSTPEVKK